MNSSAKKAAKVKATISIDKAAQDLMLDRYGVGVRGMGAFLSQLVYDYDKRMKGSPTRAELVAEIKRLIDLLAADQR